MKLERERLGGGIEDSGGEGTKWSRGGFVSGTLWITMKKVYPSGLASNQLELVRHLRYDAEQPFDAHLIGPLTEYPLQ